MTTIITNRRAKYEYFILETWEAGLVLKGSEVKSLKEGKVSIAEAWIKLKNGEAWLVDSNISEYSQATNSWSSHDPARDRKLLLHKEELNKIDRSLDEGVTLVPLDLHFNQRGIIKATIALVRGKKLHDKRQTLRERYFERHGDF